MPTNHLTRPQSARPAGRLPQIEPIPLVPRSDPFDDPDWIFEPKYDGFRGVAYGWPGGCEIRSRRDIPLQRFRGLWERVADVLGTREVILDGEIVSLNRQGRPVFRDLVRCEGFLAFAAFDLLWLDGIDLRGRPLAERKELLGGLLPEDTGPLYKILTIEEHGRALFGAIKRMDLAGVVAKQKGEPYGRGTVWYHIKNPGYPQLEGRRQLLPARNLPMHSGREG
jgi:bifunctional non-homologous end joining protein LigD